MFYCSECQSIAFGTEAEHKHYPEWEVKYDPEYPPGAFQTPEEKWAKIHALSAEHAAERFGIQQDQEEYYLLRHPDRNIRVLVRTNEGAEEIAFRVRAEAVPQYYARLERKENST